MTTPTYLEMFARCTAVQERVAAALPDAAIGLGDANFGNWAADYLEGQRGPVYASSAAACIRTFPIPHALDRVETAYKLARIAETAGAALGWLDAHNMAWGRAVSIADDLLSRAEANLGMLGA